MHDPRSHEVQLNGEDFPGLSGRGEGTVMRNPWKATLALMTAATLATGAAACGGGGSASGDTNGASGQSGAAAGADDGTQLTMWSRAPLEKQAKAAVEAYNASHQNQVKLEILPNDDVEGKLGAAVQSDSLPDILAGDVVRIPYWAQQGVFQDLTDRIDALPNKSDLQQGHIDAGTVDGVEYTLPFVTDISVMVWNKDLYEKAGLDPDQGPTSVEEFVEQAKAVAALDEDGVAGTYIPGQCGGCDAFMYFPMVWASGGEVISADGTSAELASDSAKSVFDALKSLVDTPNGVGAGSKDETGATWTAPFENGNVGVMPYPYTAVTGLFDSASFDIGVAGIPGVGGNQSTFLGGDAIGISKSSKNVDQAWDFISWLMTDVAQQEVFADNNDTASNLSVLANGYADADPRTLVANATIQDGRTPAAVNYNEAFNASGSPWQVLFQNAVFGDGTTLQADNDAITAILGQ